MDPYGSRGSYPSAVQEDALGLRGCDALLGAVGRQELDKRGALLRGQILDEKSPESCRGSPISGGLV